MTAANSSNNGGEADAGHEQALVEAAGHDPLAFELLYDRLYWLQG